MMFKFKREPLSAIMSGSVSKEKRKAAEDLFSSTVVDAELQYETASISRDGFLSLPNVILAKDDLEDLYVNVAAYYAERSPISTFVHVLDREMEDCFRDYVDRQAVLAVRRESIALIGASIGEVLIAGQGISDTLQFPSYSATRRSMAFTLARAKTLYPKSRAAYVANKWVRLRNLGGLAIKQAAMDGVLAVHDIGFDGIDHASSVNPRLFNALNAYLKGESDENVLAKTVVALYPAFEQAHAEFSGAFDKRMGVFTSLVEKMSEVSLGAASDDIVIAYLCNKILPGSFDHYKVLLRLAAFFPTALAWYGVFAVLSKGFESNIEASVLVAKLERDLVDPFSFSQRPSCDISLEELEVIARVAFRVETLRPSQARIGLIALLPGIDIFSRLSAEEDGVAERQAERRFAELQDATKLASALLEDALGVLRQYRQNTSLDVAGGRRLKRGK